MTYSTTDAAMFDTKPTSDLVHVLMPCMGYACGESILTVGGHFIVGPFQGFDTVTCEACKTDGQEALAAECLRQQREQA